MPVLPTWVTATWVQAPVGRAAGALMRCSPPAPLVVIANRAVPLELRGVKNMFVVEPEPKSNSRTQLAIVSSRTQVAMLNAAAPARMPAGRATYCPLPDRFTALPVRPAVQPAPPASVPVRPLPVASDALVPDVSLNR